MKPAVLILASRHKRAPADNLAAIESYGLPVLTADHSLGYAAAVRDGFARAMAAGHSHAITIDVDLDNDPADIPAMLSAIQQHPAAIIHGERHFQSGLKALGVRCAAGFCDVWFFFIVGKWVRDCAHPYRAYPLALLADIATSATGQQFDLEVLAKAFWCKLPTSALPVHVPRAFRAALMSPLMFARYGFVICWLLMERMMLPGPMLAAMHQGEFGRLSAMTRIVRIARESVVHECNPPGRFAFAVGVGVFLGVSPAWGFQMLLAATTAHLLRLSKRVMVASSNISLPLTIPFFIYASLVIGHFLNRGEFNGLPRPGELTKSVLLQFLGEYVVGSVALGVLLGLVLGGIAYFVARGVHRKALQSQSTHVSGTQAQRQ